MPARIMVVDDHEVVRLGLQSLLTNTEIQIIAEAASGSSALAQLATITPDLVLMDILMPDGDGLSTLTRLKLDYPNLPVLMYSGFDNPTYIARAIALGASGFIHKTEDKTRLIAAILAAAAGDSLWSAEDYRRVGTGLAPLQIQSVADIPLTSREIEVLKQIAFGLTNKEIGRALNISYETVKEHVQNLLRKIGVADRTQAAVWAIRKGLVE
ncbi:MAG: response regulator transcription factor [Pirellulales bacterium]|nr:response regulator transcription factor [Pirellulales bacterium]